jgi:hypothetical protein
MNCGFGGWQLLLLTLPPLIITISISTITIISTIIREGHANYQLGKG